MFIAILTLLSALSISGVAAYYSIIGLATIFPGAFVPVVLMGSVLEVGKLVCASWLYRNWQQTNLAAEELSVLCRDRAFHSDIHGHIWIPVQGTSTERIR
jgi:hypothetical protein